MEITKDNIDILRCIDCSASLAQSQTSPRHKRLICSQCDATYEVKNNKIYFAKQYIKEHSWKNVGADWPALDENAGRFKPSKILGPKIKDLPNYLNISDEGRCVYVGSGNDCIKGYINVDLGDYENVDIVADICSFPFKSNQLDLIVSNSTLEHIYIYKDVVIEAFRSLKSGGYIYMSVPSICPRHHAVDYHRWTMAGLKKLFDEFVIIESGACRGYADAINVMGNWLIRDKIKNEKKRNLIHAGWNIACRPLYWGGNTSEISVALSQTIFVIAKKEGSYDI